jgi:uncharacterized protein YecE (DUF72 family)
MAFYVGTSGFSYKEWKRVFYPEGLKDDDMLSFYATRLSAVEINNTFYRMPKRVVLQNWSCETPDSFRFVIKASRRITHQKRLKDIDEPMGYLIKNTAELGDKLGALLFQLPPNMRCNMDRLESLVTLIPDDVPAAIEFRHKSWFDEITFQCLRDHNITLVHSQSESSTFPFIKTADWGYFRLRNPGYDVAGLQKWADVANDAGFGHSYVFFKHEDEGAGPKLAMRFQELAL